jgi:parallel beta-helix repeat protein
MNRFLKLLQLSALLIFCYVGNIGIASAAPKSINSCQTITESGSYIVTKNLAATGHCLVLQFNNVTIDLGGHTITGNGSDSRGVTSFNNDERKDVVIRNGFITNFRYGITFNSSARITVERVYLINNYGGGVIVGTQAIIKDNTIAENGFGILVDSGSTVTSNNSSYNTNSGIRTGQGSTIIGNTTNNNGAHGILVSDGSTVSNNTAFGNTLFGVFASCSSSVTGNTAISNGTNINSCVTDTNHNAAP